MNSYAVGNQGVPKGVGSGKPLTNFGRNKGRLAPRRSKRK